jgi:lipid-A-disaccharide synthase
MRIFIVAGEHSGDRLGGKLLSALRQRLGAKLELAGVGGPDMEAEGLVSLFPMHEIAVMGIGAVLRRLPDLLARIRRTADAAIAFAPDVLVLIDSPDFTHRVAARVRKSRPEIPIVDYVSPTVWAWRPGRARKMAAYVDHVLALLPFEPEAHRRLGGPPCTYVGHPIAERLDWMRGLDTAALASRLGLVPGRPVLVVLPGSRIAEVRDLMPIFGETVRRVEAELGAVELILPQVESVAPFVEAGLDSWPRRPHIVTGETDKFASFRLATAALAASGTVTLELAAAGTPMVVAYIARGINVVIRHFLTVPSVVLANLVLGRNVFPEFIQGDCTVDKLAAATLEVLRDGETRAAQLVALAEIPGKLAPPASHPSEAAADIVMALAREGRSAYPR